MGTTCNCGARVGARGEGGLGGLYCGATRLGFKAVLALVERWIAPQDCQWRVGIFEGDLPGEVFISKVFRRIRAVFHG